MQNESEEFLEQQNFINFFWPQQVRGLFMNQDV